VIDRLRGYYADQGFTSAPFEAVLAVQPGGLPDFDRRLRAVAEFGLRPEAASLAAANKRVGNILRKQAEEPGALAIPRTVDPAHFESEAERDLAEALASAQRETTSFLEAGDYTAVLDRRRVFRERAGECGKSGRARQPAGPAGPVEGAVRRYC
jgi:glycyl-tRNA synthetase beta chain